MILSMRDIVKSGYCRICGDIMLYISRSFEYGTFGVVDTDDNVEEVVSGEMLKELVCEVGLEIFGASRVEYPSGNMEFHIFPYQVEPDDTVLQTKLRTLFGVEVVKNKGVVVGISLRNARLPRDMSIRLSDLGDFYGECILDWDFKDYSGPKLTLVVDDNIKQVHPMTFYPPISGLGFSNDVSGFVLDVRGLSDEELLYEIYNCAYAFEGDPKDAIIDREDRVARMWKSVEDGEYD